MGFYLQRRKNDIKCAMGRKRPSITKQQLLRCQGSSIEKSGSSINVLRHFGHLPGFLRRSLFSKT